MFTIASLIATILYHTGMYYCPLMTCVSAHLSDYTADQDLDKVQYSMFVCVCAVVLHLHPDHPPAWPVSEITQRLSLPWYTDAQQHTLTLLPGAILTWI